MKSILCIALLMIAATAFAAEPPAFTEGPTATRDGAAVKIAFAVSVATDCEVAIVDGAGKVIRHLAAGALGENAPPPLARATLRQELTWDGKDDAGRPADAAAARVRVSLGLHAGFERIIGWSGQNIDAPRAMACGPDGTLYIAHGEKFYGHRQTMLITAFDRDGKYLREVFPGPGDLTAEKRAGWPRMKMDDGSEVPVIQHVLTRCLYPGAFLGEDEQGNLAVTSDGRLLALTGCAATVGGLIKYPDTRGGRRLLTLGTDGSVPADCLGPEVVAANVGGEGHLAVSPDGKCAYVSGMGSATTGKAKPAAIHHVVYRVPLEGSGKAEVFLGRLHEPGGGKDRLNDPRGVDVDAAGNVYVADLGNGRIAVFSAAGKYVGEIPAEGATHVLVSRRSGAVYARIGLKLVKFGGLTDPAKKAETALPTLNSQTARHRFCMALDDSGPEPALWLAGTWWINFKIEKVLDEGGSFRSLGNPIAEAADPAEPGLPFIMNLVPLGEELITRTPSFPAASTTSARYNGLTGAYLGPFFPVGPDGSKEKRDDLFFCGSEYTAGKDGRLYTQTGGFMWPEKGSANAGTVRRYDAAGKPVPFPSLDTYVIHKYYHGHHRPAGMFVAADGTIYLAAFPGYRGRDQEEKGLHVYVISPAGELIDDRRVFICGATVGGIAVDPAGNIYMGVQIWPKNERIPPWFADRLPASSPVGHPLRAYQQHGMLVKFPPTGGRIVPDPTGEYMGNAGGYANPPGGSPMAVRVEGALWMRRIGYVPINDTREAGCQCESTRFDVDGFGRVFIPDLYRFRVVALDAAGNELTAFGAYGNMDNRGPGSPRPQPAVPLGWPIAARLAGDRVYVADLTNRRIVAARTGFAASRTVDVK